MAKGLELMLRLRDLGIVSIYAEFSGGGDDGAIDNINYHLADDTISNDFAGANEELHSDVDDYCYTLIQGGKIEDWYNNDGGFGWSPNDVCSCENICYRFKTVCGICRIIYSEIWVF